MHMSRIAYTVGAHLLTLPVSGGTATVPEKTLSGSYSAFNAGGNITTRYAVSVDPRTSEILAFPFSPYTIIVDKGDYKELDAYVKVGWYDDGVAEHPLYPFYEGRSDFMPSLINGTGPVSLKDHKWTANPTPFIPRYYQPTNQYSRQDVATDTFDKTLYWNFGTVAETDPASFPKSTVTTVTATDPSDGAKLRGTSKINWHLTPAMRFRLEGSIEPILPPDHDPGDEPGAAEWEQIEMIKETRRQLADSGIQIISVVFEGSLLVVDVMMPDVTDVALGVVKAARAVRLVGKMQDILSTIKANRLARWQAKRAARGKVGPVAAKSTTGVTNKGRVGTKNPSSIYNEADEATGTREVAVKIAKQGMCFVEGTPILMGDNTLKAIEQIKVGDLVVSREDKTNVTMTKRVTDTIKRQAPATIVLTFANNEKIETTEEHPFYVEGKGFVKAGELGIGTSIVTRAGPSLRVLDVEKKTTPTFVYNFTVEDFHTYFVGKNKLWVHNDYCGLAVIIQHTWNSKFGGGTGGEFTAHPTYGPIQWLVDRKWANINHVDPDKRDFLLLQSDVLEFLDMIRTSPSTISEPLTDGRAYFDEGMKVFFIHRFDNDYLTLPDPGTVFRGDREYFMREVERRRL